MNTVYSFSEVRLKVDIKQEIKLAQKWISKFQTVLHEPVNYKCVKEAFTQLLESYSVQTFYKQPLYMAHLINDFKYKSFKEIRDKYLTCQDQLLGPSNLTLVHLLFSEIFNSNEYNELIEQELSDLHTVITQEQAKSAPVKRDEMLRLLIYLKKEKRLLKMKILIAKF